MIVVTGGAGFIGSNLVRRLNQQGNSDVTVVDHLEDGRKSLNLNDCVIADYLDRAEAKTIFEAGSDFNGKVDLVFHLGACSDTTEWDGRYMMENNFAYSRSVFEYCIERQIPLVYASSAAVYGGGREFAESPDNERPLNVYGYSKLAFDQYVRANLTRIKSTVVGLRYFNVYGPGEAHKGNMASVAWHWYQQALNDGELRMFDASHGYGAGEQQRDFIHVDDAVSVTLWAGGLPARSSGVLNCGTGRAQTFKEVAEAIVTAVPGTRISVIDFPDGLRDAYQAYTQADLTRLRQFGYAGQFKDVASGVGEYVRWLAS